MERDRTTEQAAESPALTMATDELIAGFTAKAAPLGVRVERADDSAAAAAFTAGLGAEFETETLVVAAELRDAAPRFLAALDGAGTAWRVASAPGETRDAPLGVSLAQLAVAETGSVLLNEATIADRAIGMLAAGQLVLCPTAALVPSLDEAALVLRAVAARPGGSYATLVTGPSRTADIERVLTVGVQGPARVAVLFVDALD